MILILKGLPQRKVTKRISGHLRVEENALACRVQTADRICRPDLRTGSKRFNPHGTSAILSTRRVLQHLFRLFPNVFIMTVTA